MITIKNKASIQKMAQAGQILSAMLDAIAAIIRPGVSTFELDQWIARELQAHEMTSMTKGYYGYKHVSCISVNDVVVHGIPSTNTLLKSGDIVKVDVCASWKGHCADMTRIFFVESVSDDAKKLCAVAQSALDKGIEKARAGNRLSDISAAIQAEVELHGFGVVRDFAGHGIGKNMHEDPEVLNYGKPGCGPILRPGMALALEPMITFGAYDVYVADDGWTVRTVDKSLAAHVEDTVIITEGEPMVVTRMHTVDGCK